MITVADFIRQHSFFAGLEPQHVDFIAGCGKLRRFKANEYLGRENEPADYFYLLLEGRAVIETHQNSQPTVPLLTLGEQEVVGWSWLFPPYRWHFDARAISALRTVEMDGRCLRDKCEQDAKLGFDLMRRLAMVMMSRLHAARFQLLDVYAAAPANSRGSLR